MKTDSPFRPQNCKPQVFITKGNGPYKNTREALRNIDLSPAKGKRILLKPNVGRIAAPGSAVVTHPEVVAAAIDAFREAGAGLVAIGESPITGIKTMEAFESSGIAEIARQRNCPLIDMDERDFVEVKIPDGKALDSLKVCPEVLEYDMIVSIPVMKTHMHTGVTLAVKNMKGCLWRRSKVVLHMLPPVKDSSEKPINHAIADMAGVLLPQLSIIDCTFGLEGLGPSAGTPKELNMVIVGTDAFSTDAVACRIMGIDAADVPHLKLGAERGYGIIDIDKISINPADWTQYIAPFKEPPKNLSIEFPDVKVLDKASCSACQSTTLLFLQKYGKNLGDYFTGKPVHVAIGRGHEDVPENTLCIGNCTAKHKSKSIYVKGCPPVGSEIINTLKKHKK